MLFSFYDVLLSIGIAQGLVTALLLLISDKNHLSNRFLALGLIAFSMICLKMVMINTGITQTALFRYFPIATELSAAPLFYIYAMSLITPNFRFKAKLLWHFAPFLTIQLYVIWVYLSLVNVADMAQKDVIAEWMLYPSIKKIEDYLTVLSIIIYVYVAYQKLCLYQKRVTDNISDNSYSTFNWLRRIIHLGFAVGIFLLVNLAMDALLELNETTSLHWRMFILYVAALVYYFGFVGYRQPKFEPPAIESLLKISEIDKLPQEQVEQLSQNLNQVLLSDKVYLDPTISAQQLAKLLNTSQSNLSYVVNKHYKKSFRQLINELRINEVKLRLLDKQHARQSILSIALESGFNSEASFYRIFKKQTGLSPKAYIAYHKEHKNSHLFTPSACFEKSLSP